MKERLHAIARILKIQTELHRLAERKLAEAKAKDAAVSSEKTELIEALNHHSVFYGAFIYPMAKRLRLLDETAQKLATEIEVKTRDVVSQAIRKKGVERLHASLQTEWEHNEGKRELQELIERSADPGKASLP